MDEATSALTGLITEYFPAALRERAERVLGVRDRVRRERGSNLASFRFDLLKGEEYAALTQDILILYEVCIFDMSQEIRDIVHPNDEGIVAVPTETPGSFTPTTSTPAPPHRHPQQAHQFTSSS